MILQPDAAATLATDGNVWVAVEGDKRGSTLPHVNYGERYGQGWTAPPAEIVEALKPCSVDVRRADWSVMHCTEACGLGCHNGKRVIEVQVPCPCGTVREVAHERYHSQHGTTVDTIPVSVTVAECLPIVPPGLVVHECVMVDSAGVSLHRGELWQYITLYGNPRPGMFAVLLEAVGP
jgi:hypothetical protein